MYEYVMIRGNCNLNMNSIQISLEGNVYIFMYICKVVILKLTVIQALHVFENLDNGEILCASCPNAKTFITGGTSTVCITVNIVMSCDCQLFLITEK